MTSVVAILTYKRHKLVRAFLDSVLACSPGIKVAVFEDCGNDGTVEDLSNGAEFVAYDYELDSRHWRHPRGYEVFAADHNLGVTGQSNKALRWFERSGADHLCLCNDDLLATGDFAREYAYAHTATGNHLWTFCDFEKDGYSSLTTPFRGIEIRLQPRMTGMMMSITKPLFSAIGYFDQFWESPFGNEHSLTRESNILMGDGRWKPIKDVAVGDAVIGWASTTAPSKKYTHLYAQRKMAFTRDVMVSATVTRTHKYRAKTVDVAFASGRKVSCTPDHLWFLGKKLGYATPKVGRRLSRLYDSCASPTKMSQDYARGYICGAIDGDGCTRGDYAVLRVTNTDFVSRFVNMLKLIGVSRVPKERTYPVVTTGGITTGERRKMYYIAIPAKLVLERVDNDDFVSGWLGGMYDAEGHGGSIAQSYTASKETYLAVEAALKRFKFSVTRQKHQLNINGGKSEVLRFWNIANPACSYKIRTKVFVKFTSRKDKIVSVTPGKVRTVYCLTTDTGNYVADGYASHNCGFNNRAVFSGMVHLNGQAIRSLDIVSRHLKSVDTESTISATQKPALDKLGETAISRDAHDYDWFDLFRPFGLVWPRVVGGQGSGVEAAQLQRCGYQLVRDWAPANTA